MTKRFALESPLSRFTCPRFESTFAYRPNKQFYSGFAYPVYLQSCYLLNLYQITVLSAVLQCNSCLPRRSETFSNLRSVSKTGRVTGNSEIYQWRSSSNCVLSRPLVIIKLCALTERVRQVCTYKLKLQRSYG